MAIRRSNREAMRGIARERLDGALEALWVATGAVSAHRKALRSYLERAGRVYAGAERALSAAATVGVVLDAVEQADNIIGNCQHLTLLANHVKSAVQTASGRALLLASAVGFAVNELELPAVQRAVELFASDHISEGTDGKEGQWRELVNIAIRHGSGIEVFKLCDPGNRA